MISDLLSILRTNALEERSVIAKMLNCTEAEVNKEIETLEKSGVIRGWQAIVNDESVDTDSVTAVIEVRVTPERDGGFNKIAERVSSFDEVEEAYLMSGGYDLLLFVRGDSLISVARFVSEKLSTIHGVLSTSTHFQLKAYKRNGILMTQPTQDERLPVSP